MSDTEKDQPSRSARLVTVTGKLPSLSAKNLARLSVFLTQGNKILSEAPVSAKGAFQFHVVPHLVSEGNVSAVLGPRGVDSQTLASHATLPRVALSTVRKGHGGAVTLDFAGLKISDELIDPWWLWCHGYTISGTLETAAGCPIGAQITIYNVTSTTSGLVETPIVTVPTNASGNFTATFNWCSDEWCGWPCWPFWWHCWPWWWEWDILTVIESLERRLQSQSAGAGRTAPANVAPMGQPNVADLMTGVGFAGLRAGTELVPDSARTALISAKLADPRIREIFPWWWWCCNNPNIVFSAVQGTTTVLNEDPNTSTRWCFASGQTVSLTANSEAIGACPVTVTGECGFAWTAVGGEPPNAVLVDDMSMGYANGSGGACSNLAFAGYLNLNGVFSGDCTAYYQVIAGQWGGNGNPARGGSAPISFAQLGKPLVNYVTIWRAATFTTEQDPVVLGPFNYNLQEDLYVTLNQRQNTSTPLPAAVLAQIGNFPTLNPGDFVMGWAYPDLVLGIEAADLISPAPTGGVSLSVVPYDITATLVPSSDFDLGPDMTLMIDTTTLTQATIDSVSVHNADSSPATPATTSTGACPAYKITPGGYVAIHTTVVDNAGHLCEYYIQTQYDTGLYASATPSDRDYAQAPSTFTLLSPPAQPYGVDAGYAVPNDAPPPPPAPQTPAPSNWTFVGGGDTTVVYIPETCCYDFQLWVSKRTTDGEDSACGAWNPTFQTVNIVVTGP